MASAAVDPQQIVANARGAVTGAKDVVMTTMAEVKDSVVSTVSGVVDKTKGAVTSNVERTKSVVNGSINTVLGMVQLMNSRVDNAITKLELLVDQYFPLTQKELEIKAKKVKGVGVASPRRYCERLESLAAKLCSRAYHQALSKVKETTQMYQEPISQLQKMKESLHEVMHSFVNNTPLKWLVGPFYPQSTEVNKASLKVQQSELKAQ
ncbi:perilipin-2-like [Mastomys coucha]|uniref:perilipin-2-like n=1 Tax=Mastomys coucha TaxID=35658 RepID=UPI00126242D0|nr:perilipin-2-like [Mastomys coucha]